MEAASLQAGLIELGSEEATEAEEPAAAKREGLAVEKVEWADWEMEATDSAAADWGLAAATRLAGLV